MGKFTIEGVEKSHPGPEAQEAVDQADSEISETPDGKEADTQSDQTEEPQEDSENEGESDVDGSSDDEIVISIGDKPAKEPEREASWIKNLRKANRELSRKTKELEKRIATLTAPPEPQIKPRPKLEDFDYDDNAYESAMIEWVEQKKKGDELAEKKKRDEERQLAEWQGKVSSYEKEKAQLKAHDYQEAEDNIREMFSTIQQNVILDVAKKPALLVLALHRNEEKAKELAAIQSTHQLAAEIALMENEMKVTTRKTLPPPEKPIASGLGVAPRSGQQALDRLRAEAARTGDYTKVAAHLRKQKAR